jgi:hypothetical protein
VQKMLKFNFTEQTVLAKHSVSGIV